MSVNWDTVIQALSTLVAAFLGAYAAFELQDRKNEREIERRNRSAINRAIFDLSQLWNATVQYQREIIEPIRSTPAPWLNLRATISHQFVSVAFNTESLLFLVDTAHANLLPRLLTEEQRFRVVLGLIEERSRLVLERLQPTMEKLGYKPFQDVNVRVLEDELGPDLTHKLKSLSNAIVQFVDENVQSISKLNDELTSTMQTFFGKKHKILRVVYESPRTSAKTS